MFYVFAVVQAKPAPVVVKNARAPASASPVSQPKPAASDDKTVYIERIRQLEKRLNELEPGEFVTVYGCTYCFRGSKALIAVIGTT